jgi:alpha-L-fucosidase 2
MKQIHDNTTVFERIERHNPVWEGPAKLWQEGILLGNGEMGAVVWGDGSPLILTLDHTQFWDRNGWKPENPESFKWRYFKEAIQSGDLDRVEPAFQRPEGSEFYPTRIPPSRIEFYFEGEAAVETMALSFYTAEAEGNLIHNGKKVTFRTVLFADQNVLKIEFTDGQPRCDVKFFSERDKVSTPIKEFLIERGYPEPVYASGEKVSTITQAIPDGGEAAIAWGYEAEGANICYYISLQYERTGSGGAQRQAKDAVLSCMKQPKDAYRDHTRYWEEHYQASWLSVPDPRLESLYWYEIYKLGCCSKPGAAPISLHGPWSPDGVMPPWSGDYHHNINLQMSYWPIYTGNRLKLGESLYTYIDQARPAFRRFCREFFEQEGEFAVHAADIDGNPVYDWASGQFEFNGGPWLAHHMWLHWKYSQDRDFALNRLYPFLQAIAVPLLNELELGEDGWLHLPYSLSPEYSGRNDSIWGPDCTLDLSLYRWMLATLIECEKLGEGPNVEMLAAWQDTLDQIVPFPVFEAEDKQYYRAKQPVGLMVRGDVPLETSHRHHSHLAPIYPFKQLKIDDGTEWEQSLIQKSMQNWFYCGHGEWVGFSFTWGASIAAHANLPDLARNLLSDYAERFINDNSLMLQGPQRKSDMSVHGTYGLTIESGFGFVNALQEMLLQSHDGVIRLFPAIPHRWKEAAFENLRAEGAYLVSASYRDGRLQCAKIESEAGGKVRIRLQHPDHGFEIEHDFKVGEIFIVK